MKSRHDQPKLVAKGLLFLAALVAVCVDSDLFLQTLTYRFLFFKVYHVLWLLIVLLLLKRLFPALNHKLSSGKAFARHFSQKQLDTPRAVERFTRAKEAADRGALQSAAYWLLVVGAIGIFRLLGVFDLPWLIVITLFFVFMDQFCVSVWCPFKWLAQAKCCNACRINNWGYAMAFSPLVYYPSFWTYSLLGLSLVVVAQWEYLYLRHPERFFEASNENLLCKSCTVPSGCPNNKAKSI